MSWTDIDETSKREGDGEMRDRMRRWLGLTCLEWHLHNEVEHDLELLKQEVKFLEKREYAHLASTFGYSIPDEYCPDWNGDMHLQRAIGYRSVGCMCCNSLEGQQKPMLRNNKISLECNKGHTLVVGVLKEDET
jgi:hypothetical protein